MNLVFQKRIHIIFLLATLVNCFAFGQTTKITGKVVDAVTREPLPFVAIVFKNTAIGANTDFDGNYTLVTETPGDSIVAAYVGYDKLTKPVKKGVSQIVHFELNQTSTTLQEVIIKPGENPAHALLKKVIERKKSNDREKLKAYEYEVYNKIEFDLNNIPEEFKNKKVFKPFSFIFDNIDSTSPGEKPYLPMFMTETLSKFYYRNNPKHRKEIIKASKISGVENESVSQVMGDMYQNVNIYDNTILVFGKNFISPIHNDALLYYRMYLVDSLYLDNRWCYQIKFSPRRKQELTFYGNMWVHDTTFAIKRIEMRIAEDANINFVNNLNVIQDYVQIDTAWMLRKDRLIIDFRLKDDRIGIYGRKTTSYKDFVVNEPKPNEFYTGENLVLEEGATNRSKEYWSQARHDSLSKNEQKVYAMVDTIQALPAYKTYVDVITIIVSGYKEIGKIDVGPYSSLFSFNSVEGARFRLGFQTNYKFSEKIQFSGYSAYGVRDEEFKYGAGVLGFFSQKPRFMYGLNYKHDVEVLGQSQNAFAQDNFLASLFRRNPLNKLTMVEQYSGHLEYEYMEGLLSRLTLINRTMTPLDTFGFQTRDRGGLKQVDHITTSEIRLFTRFAYGEKYLKSSFSRVSLGTRNPVVQFQYTFGGKNIFNSDYRYDKFVININDRIRPIQLLGYTDYILEYGKIWGELAFPLLELHGGNETYTYDPMAFNMMNYYEFASDQYFHASVFHHFDGLFLNHIPLLRKLKWREVVTGKMVIGSVKTENRRILTFPSTLHALDHGPYYEAGVGIENIFKIFRIDALWRLSYRDQALYPNTSLFGVRGSLQLIF